MSINNKNNLLDTLKNIINKAKISIESIKTIKELDQFKILFLGKKSQLSNIIQQIKYIPLSQKIILGKEYNKTKILLKKIIKLQYNNIIHTTQKDIYNVDIDINLPSTNANLGSLHPISIISEKIIKILTKLGFQLTNGPEIEHTYFNFTALNIDINHPARNKQDTFYINSNILLRTHTSPIQIRTMLNNKNTAMKIFSFGKVYRRDQDLTHSPMFHQIEAIYLDKNINFTHLKGMLFYLIKKIFHDNVKLRLRPSYFPFTKPSIEIDINCFNCNNNNQICKICKNTNWIEIMGAGMVHPNVLKTSNINTKKYSGFAFGVGIERIALLKYYIPDIKLLFENNLNLLKQF